MATIRSFEDLDPKDALIITAFASTGAASPIAAQYLVKDLEMPLVGDLQTDAFTGVMHIQDGRPTSPIRIHGGEIACAVDGPCQRTYVISTEIPLPPASQGDIAQAILAWAKDARLLLSLDAVARDEHDETPDLYTLSTTPEAAKRVEPTNAPPLKRGIVAGMTALLMTGAMEQGVHAATLLVEARSEHPDGRAAAALVTGLDPLIPQISIDAEPLMKDAMTLEKEIRQAMADANKGQAVKLGHSFI